MGLFQKIFGTKPKVPELPPINFDLEQQNTAQGNLSVLPKATELGRQVNTFNQDELDRMYEEALPGYDRIKESVGKSLGSLSKGEIPDDVANEVFRRSASRAYAGGFGGSGLSRNLQGRDLGLTSLDLLGRGIDSTQRWLASATAPRFDITSMFLTPQQRIPMVIEERNAQFQRQYLKNQISAMPDPVVRGAHDGIVNLLMGAGNYFGGNYQTSSTDKWGGGGSTAPQSNLGSGGGGSYTPSNGGYGNQYGYQNYGNYEGWSGYSQPPANTGYDAGSDSSFDMSSFGGGMAAGYF